MNKLNNAVKKWIIRLFDIQVADVQLTRTASPKSQNEKLAPLPLTIDQTEEEGYAQYNLSSGPQKPEINIKFQIPDREILASIDEDDVPDIGETTSTTPEIENADFPPAGSAQFKQKLEASPSPGQLDNHSKPPPVEERKMSLFDQIKDLASASPKKNPNFRLGIDFGTSTTSVSILFPNKPPTPLPIGENREPYMPSVIYFRPGEPEQLDDRVLVGEEADRQGMVPYIIRSIKRYLGYSSNAKRGQEDYFSELFLNNKGQVKISPTEDLPITKIVFYIVREALKRAELALNNEYQIKLSDYAFSDIPVNFGCNSSANLIQREIVLEAGQSLGFKNLSISHILEEPILGGFTFARFSNTPEGRYLIYDFGGGTFDVAVIEVDRVKAGQRVTVLATVGESRLGGDDIDEVVYKHFLNGIAEYLDSNASEIESALDQLDRWRLRSQAKIAKEVLSTSQAYQDSLFSSSLGLLDLNLHREKFEELLGKSKLIERSLEATRRAFRTAYVFEEYRKNGQFYDINKVLKLSPRDVPGWIDKVVLIGGVTRIPYVRGRLLDLFDENIIVGDSVLDPICAVSNGACYIQEDHHYSITRPPYQIELAPGDATNKYDRIPLVDAFSEIKFHREWYLGSSTFSVKFQCPGNFGKGRIVYRRAGEDEWQCLHEFNQSLTLGVWTFSWMLDGSLWLKGPNSSPFFIGDAPLIHPIQEEITKARIEREKAKKLEQERKSKAQSISIYTDK